jgi:hypothetical protein
MSSFKPFVESFDPLPVQLLRLYPEEELQQPHHANEDVGVALQTYSLHSTQRYSLHHTYKTICWASSNIYLLEIHVCNFDNSAHCYNT